MTAILSPDLVRAVAASKGEDLRLRDPETNQDYVLLKAELYDRLRRLVMGDESELDMRQVGMLIHEAMREDDKNDPLLQSYQSYRRAR